MDRNERKRVLDIRAALSQRNFSELHTMYVLARGPGDKKDCLYKIEYTLLDLVEKLREKEPDLSELLLRMFAVVVSDAVMRRSLQETKELTRRFFSKFDLPPGTDYTATCTSLLSEFFAVKCDAEEIAEFDKISQTFDRIESTLYKANRRKKK